MEPGGPEGRELDLGPDGLHGPRPRPSGVGAGAGRSRNARFSPLDCDAHPAHQPGRPSHHRRVAPPPIWCISCSTTPPAPPPAEVPIKELDHLDLVQMAVSSGYAKAYHFDRLEELLIGLEEAMGQEGPVFVLVSVYRESDSPAFPQRKMAEGWAQVREQLAGGRNSGRLHAFTPILTFPGYGQEKRVVQPFTSGDLGKQSPVIRLRRNRRPLKALHLVAGVLRESDGDRIRSLLPVPIVPRSLQGDAPPARRREPAVQRLWKPLHFPSELSSAGGGVA